MVRNLESEQPLNHQTHFDRSTQPGGIHHERYPIVTGAPRYKERAINPDLSLSEQDQTMQATVRDLALESKAIVGFPMNATRLTTLVQSRDRSVSFTGRDYIATTIERGILSAILDENDAHEPHRISQDGFVAVMYSFLNRVNLFDLNEQQLAELKGKIQEELEKKVAITGPRHRSEGIR